MPLEFLNFGQSHPVAHGRPVVHLTPFTFEVCSEPLHCEVALSQNVATVSRDQWGLASGTETGQEASAGHRFGPRESHTKLNSCNSGAIAISPV